MQTRSVAGVSLTLQTAEAVKPYRLPVDFVVTTLTADPRRDMPSRNAALSTLSKLAIHYADIDLVNATGQTETMEQRRLLIGADSPVLGNRHGYTSSSLRTISAPAPSA
jgi:hypothetical protein